jgi:hypothetical protein
MIDIAYSVTEAEYLEAQSLYVRRKSGKTVFLLRGVIVLGALVASVRPLLATLRDGDPFDWTRFIAPLLFAAVFIFALPYLQRRAFRKRFKIESANLTNVRMKLSESGMEVDVPGTGHGFLEWSGLSEWLEGKLVFMAIAGYTFRPIPKSALTPQQIDEVRDLLSLYIKPAE